MAYQGIHLREDQAERYAMGRALAEETAEWEEHLLECESCRRLVGETDAYVAAMRRAAGEFARVQVKPRRGWKSLPWLVPAAAAPVLLAAALVMAVRHSPEPASAAFTVVLEAHRGPVDGARVPAGAPLLLRADLTGLPREGSYSLELVDGRGLRVWRGALQLSGDSGAATAPALGTGTYFVRVYSAQGRLLREFALEVAEKK